MFKKQGSIKMLSTHFNKEANVCTGPEMEVDILNILSLVLLPVMYPMRNNSNELLFYVLMDCYFG